MRNDAQEKGAAFAIREAGTFVLAFLQALGDMFDAWGLPSSGKVQKKASLLEQRNVVPECGGVVEHAAPLHRHLRTDWGGLNIPQIAESGVAAEGGSHLREGAFRLFQQVGLGGVPNIAVNLTRKNIGRTKKANPLGGPHLEEGAGDVEFPLCAHSDLA